jgi:hypothetical protein
LPHGRGQALRAFRDSPQSFDIILTDEAMPELTGTLQRKDIAECFGRVLPG